MEDLTSILGIVVAAGILIAKAAVRKTAADTTKKSPADPHGEAWPQIPPAMTRPAMTTPRPAMTRDEEPEPATDAAFGPIARKIAAAQKSIQAAEEMLAAARSSAEPQDQTREGSDDWSTIPTQVTAPRSAAQVVSGREPAVVSAVPRQNMQAPRPSAAAQENRRKKAETPATDFDLRKAIIASEILRPKFDE